MYLYRMYKARQYFDLCLDTQGSTMYIIGGYNEQQGILASWEKLCLKTYKFTRIRSLKTERLNCSSTLIGKNYIYVFNGSNAHGDLDTIEKYNIKLNFWELLSIKTPLKMHNNFAWTVNSKEIVITGGQKCIGKPQVSCTGMV